MAAKYPQIPTTIKARRKFLQRELRRFQGEYKCTALKCKVHVFHASVKETAHWAALSNTSTKLALRLPYIIENAKIYKVNQSPKNNHQISKFHFTEIAQLICGLRGIGTALLTIGYRVDGIKVEYCITDFRAKLR